MTTGAARKKVKQSPHQNLQITNAAGCMRLYALEGNTAKVQESYMRASMLLAENYAHWLNIARTS